MVQEILKLMLLAAIHKNYLQQFWTEDFDYVCTLSELLDSLAPYLVKTSKELTDNDMAMQKPWDATKETIHALFGRILEGRRFNPSIPEETVVRQTVNIICANPGFKIAFNEWSKKKPADQTWDKMVVLFVREDKARLAHDLLRPTMVIPTYPGAANSATNPATTTPPSEVELLRKSVLDMTKAMNKLIAAPTGDGNSSNTTANNNNNTRRARRGNPPDGGRIPTDTEAANLTYCWTHGYCIKGHNGQADDTSATCKYTMAGHKPNATATNKLGGECRICNSWRPGWTGLRPNGE
jgi:hypothetical protein